jgi:Family of unknown function (DUF6263)
MKKTVILLTVSIAGSSLILSGCSKSQKSEPMANNSNSPAAASAEGGATANGPIDLKMKWQVGKQYDMEMDLNQVTDINMPGRPIHQELKLIQGLDYSPLKDLDNGGHQLQLEFDHQNFGLSQNGKDVLSYDSTQKVPIQPDSPVAPVAAAMHAMLGVPLVYTMAADGTVEKIDGIDTLTSRITAALPDQRQRVALQQLYDEDTLKQYGSFSQALPGHPVSIGDSWSASHDVTSPTGVMTVDATYTFKDWQQHDGHNCVHFLVTGDIKTKTASASTVGAVVNIQSGTINGDVWFDPDQGIFVEDKTDQDLTLKITTRSTAFTEHMKQNVTMSLLGVNP